MILNFSEGFEDGRTDILSGKPTFQIHQGTPAAIGFSKIVFINPPAAFYEIGNQVVKLTVVNQLTFSILLILTLQFNNNVSAAEQAGIILKLQSRRVFLDFKTNPTGSLSIGKNRSVQSLI